ncbi:MAG: AI-2E family transporter [Candidatus Latescibacterota bacterium]|nr:MAG: AI-2E family transporter [Candidatus Latescibacterota bacterium]
MIRQFLMTILLAAIFSGLAHPLYSKLTHWFRGKRGFASVVTLLVILLVIVGPLIFFLGVLASQAYQIAQAVGPWIQEQINEPDSFDRLLERFPVLERLRPYRTQVITKLGQAVGVVGNFLVNGLSATTRGTVSFFFHFSLMLYAMFFFLMDGRAILNKILSYIPLSREDTDRLVGKFLSVSRATLKGTLVIGVVQGVLAGLAFAVAGIQGAVFWGTVMTVLSIIPGIGAAIVWVPAVVYLLVTGQVLAGVLLAIWCAVVVGTADNLLRPRLVGRDIKMHELLILFGTLGGVFLFGVVGFIIGPVLAALFVTIWEIYGVVFQEALPKRKTRSKDVGMDAPP